MQIEELYKKLGLDQRTAIIDSRNVPKDSVFFGIRGEVFDGNAFAAQALEQGASFAVVDDASLPEDDRYVVVGNTLETLQKLAAYHRSLFSIPVIAVGGSNGKTTTKELIRVVLGSNHRTVATMGNFNNHVGVPLTLLRIRPEHQVAVIEIGANHEHEHQLLCGLVAPTHVIVTNNGKDHLEGFGSAEGVRRANREIYDYARTHGSTAFVSSTHADLLEDSEGLSRIVYGVHTVPSFFATVEFEGVQIASNLVGSYNGENIAAGLAIGAAFSVPVPDMKAAIESYVPSMLRSQVIKKDGATWILDCYNANPSSMSLGLESFSKSEADQKAVILGDMFELGDHSSDEHRAMVDYVASLKFEKIVLVGKAFYAVKSEIPNSFFFESSQEAKEFVADQDWSGYSVFVKGSRGMKLETLLPFEIPHS